MTDQATAQTRATPERQSRLFFALWPPPAVARALLTAAHESAARQGGRVTRFETLHLTLAFLGETPDSRLPALVAIGEASAQLASPFDMVIDSLGYWSRKHIVWAGPSDVPPGLSALAEDLGQRLGDSVADRRFNPHITLVRKTRGAPAGIALPPLAWTVDALHLVRSVNEAGGARYETVGHWPFAAGS